MAKHIYLMNSVVAALMFVLAIDNVVNPTHWVQTWIFAPILFVLGFLNIAMSIRLYIVLKRRKKSTYVSTEVGVGTP